MHAQRPKESRGSCSVTVPVFPTLVSPGADLAAPGHTLPHILPGLGHLSSHTQPFLHRLWGSELRASRLLGKHSKPLSHLPRPGSPPPVKDLAFSQGPWDKGLPPSQA